MSYGSNLLVNPSADDGLTGWTTSNVTAESGEGTNYFLLAATAYMYQVVSSGTIGTVPDIDFKITVDFKLTTAQELYDNDIKGWVNVEILYSDSSKSKFRVPCVLGVDMEGRNLAGAWLRAEAECTVKADLAITSVTVRIETSALTDGLKIDQIKLEKNLEKIIGTIEIDSDGNEVITSIDEGEPIAEIAGRAPTFQFTIPGVLEVGNNQPPATPVPYIITAIQLYAYVKIAPVDGDVVIEVNKNGTPIGTVTILSGNQTGTTTISVSFAVNDIITIDINDTDYVAEGLTIQVRC